MLHADYSQVGALIRIAFFDDRIDIESPGILLPGMTIDDMKQGMSRLRNRVIARVFRELNLNPALAIALIEMTLPDKPSSRLQKYRMTFQGQAYHAAIKK